MRVRILLLWALAVLLPALQLQDVELQSPGTTKRFPAVIAVSSPHAAPGPADMGEDDDGCRHSSGPSEYDYTVVVDPHTYFAALAAEWDSRSGRFLGDLTPEFLDWVRREFNSEREIDWNHAFQQATQIARATGQPPPDRATFVIPQNMIPLEKRYRLALACYERRGSRHIVLAKIALNGAWSLRRRAQVPVSHQSLIGGFQEINDRISRQIRDGEAFDLEKWTRVYREIIEKDGLTREGYTVATMALFGFLLRHGDLAGCRELLDKAMQRLGRDDRPDVLRGLIRERRRLLDEHNKLLALAAERFTLALRQEEVVRQRIPEILLAVAEAHRRLGDARRSADWYLALARLPETQPSIREAARFAGKERGLPADKPYLVQLGWIADERFERLQRQGANHPGELSGPDRALLIAIVNEGLGTASYNAAGWKPISGRTQDECRIVLDAVGKALLDYAFRLGSWPRQLGELWEREVLRDRNFVNRFHCPVSGQPLRYAVPPGDLSALAPTTVLVATPAPVPTAQGPRYGAFCANARIVWVEQMPTVGQPLSP
ncbi:MAG: hypothetical protein N3B15_04045 [Planctomycetota bacterium]|nr:hypothetical protein [Planctomycetota bacterium]